MYTHAHGHQCTREHCDPIVVSKRGIIKPSRPTTAHTHISKYICDKTVSTQDQLRINEASAREIISKENLIITKSTNTEPNQATTLTTTTTEGTQNTQETSITSMKSVNNPQTHANELTLTKSTNIVVTVVDVHVQAAKPDTASISTKSVNAPQIQANKDTPTKSTNTVITVTDVHVEAVKPDTASTSKNTTELHDAAEGLLMLQELSNMDLPDTKDETELPINIIEQSEITDQADASSDETVIYDASDFNIIQQVVDPDPKPKKGILTITEIGIKSKPTDSSTTATPVGPITSEGKLRCDFCMRSFNTQSEKNQHMNRRHADG